MIFSVVFWKAVGERAIRAFVLGTGSALGVGAVNLFDASVPWRAAISAGLSMAIGSLVISFMASGATGGGPSILNSEKLAPGADARHAADGD